MATILVYNQDTNKIERYNRGPNEAMPYVTGNTLTVKEFRGSSGSDIMWTTKAFMEAWNSLRRQWGKPIYVGYAFKRIWQGGHSGMSQHYAGLAIDICEDSDKFMGSKEDIWLQQNAYKFGFIIRYSKGKEHITGYKYEPWHLRYVGREHAKNIYFNNITLEQYLGINKI